jgi:hypothetical protein
MEYLTLLALKAILWPMKVLFWITLLELLFIHISFPINTLPEELGYTTVEQYEELEIFTVEESYKDVGEFKNTQLDITQKILLENRAVIKNKGKNSLEYLKIYLFKHNLFIAYFIS